MTITMTMTMMKVVVTLIVMWMMTALVILLYFRAVYACNGFSFPANQLATDARYKATILWSIV